MMTQPVLSQLARDTGDNSFIGIEQGGRLIIAAHALGDGVIRVAERQKWQEQFHCTGVGKVFLLERGVDWLKTLLKGDSPEKLTDKTITAWKELESEISLSQKRGFVSCENESSLGISSIGVPVKDKSGKFLCALSQSFPTYFLKEKTILLKDRAVMLQKAAEKIASAVLACGAGNN
jgi:DNA-binding IclR family transcriptional regulator